MAQLQLGSEGRLSYSQSCNCFEGKGQLQPSCNWLWREGSVIINLQLCPWGGSQLVRLPPKAFLSSGSTCEKHNLLQTRSTNAFRLGAPEVKATEDAALQPSCNWVRREDSVTIKLQLDVEEAQLQSNCNWLRRKDSVAVKLQLTSKGRLGYSQVAIVSLRRIATCLASPWHVLIFQINRRRTQLVP